MLDLDLFCVNKVKPAKRPPRSGKSGRAGRATGVHMAGRGEAQAYLPGTGDTVIHQAVLPGRGLSIALRLG